MADGHFRRVLIDAFLLAYIHVQYLLDHGYELRPNHHAVAKPAPP